ncbi:MAG TPA: hypothetical protein VK578_08570 [Edaphobacter sp.]|nr:hypothetical protein [Edaphobacter sp.]
MLRTLAHRSDMTGADRTWAARYEVGDVLRYNTGSKAEGIKRGSFATVRSVDAKANNLTVELASGESVTYDPRRLRGVSAYRETPREFATGDRIQFTQSDREHRIRSGDVATVERIAADNGLTVKLDNGKSFELNRDQAKHIDYGYTGDGLQRLAADRVIGTAENSSLQLSPTSRRTPAI